MIASTSSPPFFLIFQSLCLNYSISFGFSFLEMSSLGRAANGSSSAAALPFLPPAGAVAAASSAAAPLTYLFFSCSPFLY
jgi:hypothetical protein